MTAAFSAMSWPPSVTAPLPALIGLGTLSACSPAADVRGFVRDVTAGKTAADVKTSKHGRAIVRGGAGAAARALGLLGAILSHAVEQHYRSDNPARGVRRARDKRREVLLTAAQYRLLGQQIDAADARGESWQAITMARLLALTGCRRGEIEKLQRDAIDLGNSLPAARQQQDRQEHSAARGAGSGAAAAALARGNDAVWVFPSERNAGKPFLGLPKAWGRIVAGKLRLSPHGLRHAFASSAEELGFTLPTIAALLGHGRAGGVTGGYIHKLDSALIAAANRVGVHIAGAMAGTAGATILTLRSGGPA